jgi:preprotein translocase subunit SecA
VIYHTSLSDALMMHFGGDRLRDLMKQLGMEEQECISHPAISRAIRNAQEKIAKQVQLEVRTMSPEEWFKYNLPQKNEPF